MNPAENHEPASDLRARLYGRHLQLQAAGPGPWPEDLVTATLNDTVALLNLQQQHAARAIELQRAEGARVIRIIAQAGSAALAMEAAAALTGLLALGWLTAFGPLLIATLSIWASEKNQPAHRQRSRLTATALLDLAAVWTGLVAGTDLSFTWALPAIGVAIAAVLTWFRSSQPAAHGNQGEGRR